MGSTAPEIWSAAPGIGSAAPAPEMGSAAPGIGSAAPGIGSSCCCCDVSITELLSEKPQEIALESP
jgi:hypothetical protein